MRGELVSVVQRPAVPLSLEFSTVGAGTVLDAGHAASDGPIQSVSKLPSTVQSTLRYGPVAPDPYRHTRHAVPELLGDGPVGPSPFMNKSTAATDADGQQRVGKLSGSSSSVSTVQEFVYESATTIGSDSRLPLGQRSPPHGQPATPAQHGRLSQQSTPPTQQLSPPTHQPLSSQPTPPTQHSRVIQHLPAGQRLSSTQSPTPTPLQPTAAADAFADDLSVLHRQQHEV